MDRTIKSRPRYWATATATANGLSMVVATVEVPKPIALMIASGNMDVTSIDIFGDDGMTGSLARRLEGLIVAPLFVEGTTFSFTIRDRYGATVEPGAVNTRSTAISRLAAAAFRDADKAS